MKRREKKRGVEEGKKKSGVQFMFIEEKEINQEEDKEKVENERESQISKKIWLTQ